MEQKKKSSLIPWKRRYDPWVCLAFVLTLKLQVSGHAISDRIVVLPGRTVVLKGTKVTFRYICISIHIYKKPQGIRYIRPTIIPEYFPKMDKMKSSLIIPSTFLHGIGLARSDGTVIVSLEITGLCGSRLLWRVPMDETCKFSYIFFFDDETFRIVFSRVIWNNIDYPWVIYCFGNFYRWKLESFPFS